MRSLMRYVISISTLAAMLLGVASPAAALYLASRQQVGPLGFSDCLSRASRAIQIQGLTPEISEGRFVVALSATLGVQVICYGESDTTTVVTVIVAAATRDEAVRRLIEVAEFVWTGGAQPTTTGSTPPPTPPSSLPPSGPTLTPLPPRPPAAPPSPSPSSFPPSLPPPPPSPPPLTPSTSRPTPSPSGGGPTMLPLPSSRVIEPVLGTWSWDWSPPGGAPQSFGTITFLANGRVTWSGGSYGTWTRSGNTYTMVWPNSVDTMTISADLRTLTGRNVQGWSGVATRQ